jgi:hypothetical protein
MLLQPLSCVAAGSEPATPSNLAVDAEIPTSPTPVNAHGPFHAVYGLHLTNFRSNVLHLGEFDVTDISGRESLARYDGQSLVNVLARPVAPADQRAIGAGMSAVGVRAWVGPGSVGAGAATWRLRRRAGDFEIQHHPIALDVA